MWEFVNILVYHPLSKNKLNLENNSVPFVYYFATIQDLVVVMRENKKFLLELKDSLLRRCDTIKTGR